jgi:hypothetical protein
MRRKGKRKETQDARIYLEKSLATVLKGRRECASVWGRRRRI